MANNYRSGEFYIGSTVVMDDEDLSCEAKALFNIFSRYANKDGVCFPSNETLMRKMNCSEKSLRKYKKQLIDSGYISRYKNISKKGTYSPNTYKIEYTFINSIGTNPSGNFYPMDDNNHRVNSTLPIGQNLPTPSGKSYPTNYTQVNHNHIDQNIKKKVKKKNGFHNFDERNSYDYDSLEQLYIEKINS